MNRPASNVRLLGSAGMAIPVAVVCAAIVLGWLQGSVPGLAAFVAVLALARTLAAVKEVRRYQAWSGQWQAMGASLNAPPQPAKKRGGGWQRVTAAVLLLLVIPAYLRQAEGTGGLATPLEWLWVAVCLYLVWKLFRRVRGGFVRSAAAGAARGRAKAVAAPVAWLVARASSSPSRADATRQLPEYCARLLSAAREQARIAR